jgi:hypothetical protein
MQYAVTAREIDELEQLLIHRHNSHRQMFGSLSQCVEQTCVDARTSIAWLRSQIQVDENSKTESTSQSDAA